MDLICRWRAFSQLARGPIRRIDLHDLANHRLRGLELTCSN